MDYEELFNIIRRKLYEVREVSDTISVDKFINFIETEEIKMTPSDSADLPF